MTPCSNQAEKMEKSRWGKHGGGWGGGVLGGRDGGFGVFGGGAAAHQTPPTGTGEDRNCKSRGKPQRQGPRGPVMKRQDKERIPHAADAGENAEKSGKTGVKAAQRGWGGKNERQGKPKPRLKKKGGHRRGGPLRQLRERAGGSGKRARGKIRKKEEKGLKGTRNGRIGENSRR